MDLVSVLLRSVIDWSAASLPPACITTALGGRRRVDTDIVDVHRNKQQPDE